MTLQDIETKYGFQFPALYKQLDADGMLNVGEYGPDWYTFVYPTLKDNPPLLLHSYDFELLNLKSVDEEIAYITGSDDYRNIDKEFKFIPFAKSGGGDDYCFFLNGGDDANIPIVYVYHDANEVDYLAKNLQDFIFKMLLTDMSNQDIYNEVSDEEFRNDIESVFKSHHKYLTEEQNRLLRHMLKREIIDYEIVFPNMKEPARGLLTDIELKNLLNNIIPFENMDQSFKYSSEW
ncbi:SMI1/KNR4 family protein [Flavobacterium chilense]|uniref:SMI1 / KNR4 family (SUKH-1) n=1 Tax=Flavobacterium chilense TaxID=946677 RepID=A0A1M7GLL9_9FLAO|nr:SMI1/KNR4 family protein [Flavobacterium chilense]SHM17183.1 SMI1 / KNR4 family (SUKH-1) [Flavobacterium chilense]